MARPKNPQRKTELMAQIIEYLRDKPLSSLTFRTLAEALEVSHYVLVYHFGNREQLIHEITSTVGTRADEFRRENEIAAMSWDEYKTWADQGWAWVISERSRPLRRLGMEAAMQDLVAENPKGTARQNYDQWRNHTRAWLLAQGLDPQDAETDSRMLIAALFGLGYDTLIHDDPVGATAAYEALMESFRHTVDRRLGCGGQSVATVT
jgi:AcrR family transcriptional regulator